MRLAVDVVACLAAGMCSLQFVRLKIPWGFLTWIPKLVGESGSAYLAVAGGLGVVGGALLGSWLAVVLGALAAVVSADYAWRASRPSAGFEEAFGADWRREVRPECLAAMLKHRFSWRMPSCAKPRWDRDVVFWTVFGDDRTDPRPGAGRPQAGGRDLLCDLWQPPPGVSPSGLGLIYFHGSAWYLLDKDVGTRPMFRHLAAQGHVVMDVAYRLCPEVAIRGMVGDVKRAIAWLKAHGRSYGVNPERIALIGASAGGQIALLAAYAPSHPQLTPSELAGSDTAVRGVVSYYGPTDLMLYYHYLGPKILGGKSNPQDSGFKKSGRLDELLGGQPDEVPEMYELASPVAHVSSGSPPTLLFHGEHDMLVPVEGTRVLERKLAAAGVPAASHIFPRTDHAFDLILPRVSPAAQAALYETERFLAGLA